MIDGEAAAVAAVVVCPAVVAVVAIGVRVPAGLAALARIAITRPTDCDKAFLAGVFDRHLVIGDAILRADWPNPVKPAGVS